MSTKLILTPHDKARLRELALRLKAHGESDTMRERTDRSRRINACQGGLKPLVALWPAGQLVDEVVVPQLRCEQEWARRFECEMIDDLHSVEVIGDDSIIPDHFQHRAFIQSTSVGAEWKQTWGTDAHGDRGSMKWEAPLKNLPEDLDKLHFREHFFDRERHDQERVLLQEALDGIMPVKWCGCWYDWSWGLTVVAGRLLGLERLLMAFYDEPEHLHRLMAFLRDDALNFMDWMEREGVLAPQDGWGIMAAGGWWYTDDLPQRDYVPGQPARMKDMWGLCESQETVGVSPAMFEEFVFQYQLPIAKRFGLSAYGCCEPLHDRWHVISKIPNLRRVSVSPWANQKLQAEQIGHNYVFSRKPNPALICKPHWDEEIIRKDLRETLEISKGLAVEFIMKDVMTVQGEPWRYRRWVELAREEIDRVYA